MKALFNEPLTDEEQQFADEHFGLIPIFLKQHNAYGDDLTYDCIITGFIYAVKKYFAEEQLRQYAFGTICKYSIKTRLGNLWRSRDRKAKYLRQIDLIAYDNDGDEVNMYESIPDESDQFELIYYNDYFDRIANILSDEEKTLVAYLLNDYTQREIGREINCSQSYVTRKIEKIRSKVIWESHV